MGPGDSLLNPGSGYSFDKTWLSLLTRNSRVQKLEALIILRLSQAGFHPGRIQVAMEQENQAHP
jgi:hypothetical protein